MSYVHVNSSFCQKADCIETLIFIVQKICLQVSFWRATDHTDIIEF